MNDQIKDMLANPFDGQLDRYKWMTFWLLIAMIVGFVAIEVLFVVPSADPAEYLGELYFIYMVVLSIAAISFMAFFFMLGITVHVWMMKKATDMSLRTLLEGEFIASKKEKE